jgi:hypothetical protein
MQQTLAAWVAVVGGVLLTLLAALGLLHARRPTLAAPATPAAFEARAVPVG